MAARQLIVVVALGMVCSSALADEPREIPEALVPILSAAEKALEAGDAKKAIAYLHHYAGEPDPLHQLLLGHAQNRFGANAEAEKAYRRALELDPRLRPAAMGLVRLLVDRRSWSEAAGLLSHHVDFEVGCLISTCGRRRKHIPNTDL